MNTTYHGFDKSSKFSNNVTYTCNGAHTNNCSKVNHGGSMVENIIGFFKMIFFIAVSSGLIGSAGYFLLSNGIVK